jgi:molybdopterin converting factor small subunit
MAKILIPTPLRQYAGKQDSVELPGATVGDVLHSLTSQYSELRRHLYTTTTTFAIWIKKRQRSRIAIQSPLFRASPADRPELPRHQ